MTQSDSATVCYFLLTRVGNLLGEKNARRAGVASNASMMIAFMIGCVFRYARSHLNLSCAIQMAMIEASTLTVFIFFCPI